LVGFKYEEKGGGRMKYNRMKYKYGASFNCICSSTEDENVCIDVGYANEGSSFTLDFVGNDLDLLEQHITNIFTTNHTPTRCPKDYYVIGMNCNVGGKIVSVILNSNRDIEAVIFENPELPVVVE
jgi:hypothetical protein